MPSFCAVFKCGNNFKRDGDKSFYRLPAVVIRRGLLRENLSREKERKGACRRQTSGGQRDVCVRCIYLSAVFHRNFGDR